MNETFYTVYRTTNIVNSKFYVGVHKTKEPNDDYLGSGTLLRRAIAKYGIESFRKEVLCVFSTDKEAFIEEERLVEFHRGNPLCYNLRKGGAGGFDYMNRNGFSALGGSRSGPTRIRKRAEDPAYRKKLDDASRKSLEVARKFITREMILANREKALEAWKKIGHSDEYKQRKRLELLGDKNPRRGKLWINLGGTELAVTPEDAETYFLQGWDKGRSKRYWVEPFVEKAIPRKSWKGKPTHGVVRKSRRRPKSEWKRKLPNWPTDERLLQIVSEIGERAFARSIGCSHVAVNARIKKIKAKVLALSGQDSKDF